MHVLSELDAADEARPSRPPHARAAGAGPPYRASPRAAARRSRGSAPRRTSPQRRPQGASARLGQPGGRVDLEHLQAAGSRRRCTSAHRGSQQRCRRRLGGGELTRLDEEAEIGKELDEVGVPRGDRDVNFCQPRSAHSRISDQSKCEHSAAVGHARQQRAAELQRSLVLVHRDRRRRDPGVELADDDSRPAAGREDATDGFRVDRTTGLRYARRPASVGGLPPGRSRSTPFRKAPLDAGHYE